MAEEKRIEIEVTIGRSRRTMVLGKTRAPRSYDGFGTIELYSYAEHGCAEEKRERMVLIDATHFDWQTMRYFSGMGGYEPAREESLRGWAEEKLLKRLAGVGEE